MTLIYFGSHWFYYGAAMASTNNLFHGLMISNDGKQKAFLITLLLRTTVRLVLAATDEIEVDDATLVHVVRVPVVDEITSVLPYGKEVWDLALPAVTPKTTH